MITIKQAEEYGYWNCKVITFQGEEVMAGLCMFAFTIGLVFGLDETGYYGRYCFSDGLSARLALQDLTEIPDDLVIDGTDWIKYKGRGGDLANPNKEPE